MWIYQAGLTTAREGITIFMQRASQNDKVLDFFIDLLDKYLYDPNSPMRNEELYIRFWNISLIRLK